MKANKILVISIIIVILAALLVLSQDTDTALSVEEKQDCVTTFYNTEEPSYGYVERTRNTYADCFNEANSSYYKCANGTESYQNYEFLGIQTVQKNKTECKATSFVVSSSNGFVKQQKEIDFSSWGVCVQENEGDCIAILCGTLEGGSARNGIFNGCDGGKQCKKFLFCGDEVKTYVKGSNEGFVSEDPTYRLPSLNLEEAGQ